MKGKKYIIPRIEYGLLISYFTLFVSVILKANGEWLIIWGFAFGLIGFYRWIKRVDEKDIANKGVLKR